MPGAPNRPPEIDAPAPPPVVTPEDPRKRVLRRLGPARIALRLDLWKGAPSAELVEPLVRAEASFSAGDLPNATSSLDQLAVRFAEPRWPTMPEPFKQLRVSIPAPMPPHWDPEFTLPPAEKELRRLRREAELQVALAAATAAWATAHQVDLPDAAGHAERAKAALASSGPGPAVWDELEALWSDVRERVPMPSSVARPAAPPPPPPSASAISPA